MFTNNAIGLLVLQILFCGSVLSIVSNEIDPYDGSDIEGRIIAGSSAKTTQEAYGITNKIGPYDGSDIEGRIIAGSSAETGQFPYAAALYFQGEYICTASIISPATILTAAHCLIIDGEVQKPSEFSVKVGDVNISSSEAETLGVSKITIHPKFNNKTFDNDVAYLTLLSNLQFNDRIKPICLADPNTPLDFNIVFVTEMGWGQTTRSPGNAEVLQYAKAKVLPHVTCRLRYPLIVTNKNKICADGFGKSICKGDSGGPLVHEDGDATVQLGIASFINSIFGCGTYIVAPSVYTRVPAVVDWIKESSNDADICIL